MARYNIDVNTPQTFSPDPFNTGAPRASMLNASNMFYALASGSYPGDSTVRVASEGVAASGTVTLASCAANTIVEINGVDFLAISGTATAGNNEFDISGDDTADAVALAAAINASTSTGIANVVSATSALGVVTVTSLRAGLGGNSVTIGTGGIRASGTVTYSTSSGAQTVVVNGVTVYNATGATDAANATAAAAAINASTDPLVSGHVKAVARAGVCFIYAAYASVRGNAITLSATGTGATASVARLAGATEASSSGAQATGTVTISGGSGNYTVTINGVNASGTVAFNTSDTQTAADIRDAINKSTNALVADVITATSSSGVVTITATRGGISGNTITLACTGTGATASVARLAGGAAPTTVAASATRLASGTATYTTFSR